MPGRGPPLSIKGQALLWLSQREHSRSELRRKLLERERRRARHAERAGAGHPGPGAALESPDPEQGPGRHRAPGDAAAPEDPAGGEAGVRCASPECIDHLLDWLEQQGYLSNQRFIDSRVRVRAERHGSRRVEAELAQHGLSLAPEQRQALQASEFVRAQATWARRFGQPPADLAARAKQTRFLLQRGFAPSVVRQVISGMGALEDDEPAA